VQEEVQIPKKESSAEVTTCSSDTEVTGKKNVKTKYLLIHPSKVKTEKVASGSNRS